MLLFKSKQPCQLPQNDKNAIPGNSVKNKSIDRDAAAFKRLLDELIKEVNFLSGKVCLQSCQNPNHSVKIHTLKTSSKFYSGRLSLSGREESKLLEVKNRIPGMASILRNGTTYISFDVFKITVLCKRKLPLYMQ